MSNHTNHQDSGAAGLPAPPPADRFPEFPASWYLFGRSRDLSKPQSKRILGRQLVAFRTRGGKISVLAANCSHMGADLGCGNVIGDSIQCPFHNWKYGADGVCNHIPGTTVIPEFARQGSYPTEERHGYVFFFNGPKALFPLPFFWGANPEEYCAGKIFSYVSDCNWYVNAAHGFDTQHFDAVHDRKLVAPPQIDCPHPFARRNTYRAEVLGRTRLDKFLKVSAGRNVEICITNWGGTFVTITGDFDHAHSRFIIATQPLDRNRTLCEGIVFAPRLKNPLARLMLEPLMLATRRFFTHGYLKDESNRLLGTRYNPGAMIPHDRDMIDYFNWVVRLPQTAEEMDARKPGHAAGGKSTFPSPSPQTIQTPMAEHT
jgi:nitrite reductase/ring-hydroxylating ferredoxin subunit